MPTNLTRRRNHQKRLKQNKSVECSLEFRLHLECKMKAELLIFLKLIAMLWKLVKISWGSSGEFVYRHHVMPREGLYVPKESSFPFPLKFLDVVTCIFV